MKHLDKNHSQNTFSRDSGKSREARGVRAKVHVDAPRPQRHGDSRDLPYPKRLREFSRPAALRLGRSAKGTPSSASLAGSGKFLATRPECILRVVLRISGVVQGVGFRFFARDAAVKFGLTGFVRNEPDGSVATEAEGDEADLERFLAWCRKGPPFAKVEKIDFKFSDRIRNYEDFAIE
ncbi:MAG TPA: acylphosphatase [Candidatus Paceibacterota bacterium]|nr:acylphosphatase [Candidatus Paceibacterota bacterium]